MSNKTTKSIKNAKVTFIFYFVSVLVAFVSRKVFIETLGTELVGLSATMQNILGFLNLAELGVFSAVSYALYKPIVEDDKEQTNKIVSLFGYLYRWIGFFILIAGIILSLFLPQIFAKSALSTLTLYLAYYAFLSVSLFSYFNNYRQVLLVANQKNYMLTKIVNYSMIVKILIQIGYLKYLNGNYFGWLAIEFLFGMFTRWWTNRKVMLECPWLKPHLQDGRRLMGEFPDILKNVKRLFAHKIAEFILLQTDSILIYSFTSLSAVTLFTNYTMVIKRIITIIVRTLGSNVSGIGQVVAEGDMSKTKRLFREFNAMFFLVGGIAIFMLYLFTEPFISLWLGREFLLPQNIFILLLINAFITFTRQPIQLYINAFGLYADVWAAWAEALLNLIISLVFGYYYGIVGVVLGTLVSTVIIVVFWKPYYMFTVGLKTKYWDYWKDGLVYLFLLLITGAVLLPFKGYLFDNSSYLWLIVNAIISLILITLIYGVLMYLFGVGTKPLFIRIFSLVQKKIIKNR